jgi:hypothetical protein
VAKRIGVTYRMLTYWVDQGILEPEPDRRRGPDGSSIGYPFRWDEPAQAAAAAVAQAHRAGLTGPLLDLVAEAVMSGRGQLTLPHLRVIVDPYTVDDVWPIDRHTVVVQT